MDGSDLVLVLCRLYFAHYLLCSPICHISPAALNVKCKCHMVKAVRVHSLLEPDLGHPLALAAGWGAVI